MGFKVKNSFQRKVTLVLISTMLFIGLLTNYFIYSYTLDSQHQQLREKLMVVAQIAALTVDGDALKKIPLEPRGVRSKEFVEIAERLRSIRDINAPHITYIYIMTKTAKEGILQFIVDPDPDPSDGQMASYPGQEYDATRFPEMTDAFNGSTADKDIVEDEWGMLMSGYAPIYDGEKRVVAILGVDILADDVVATRKVVKERAGLVFIAGLIASLLLAVSISSKISDPLEKLARAAYKVGQGDLDQAIDIKTQDELGALANSFNNMTQELSNSREEMYEYFYRVMESFVAIIEANDKYTKGHSERVAQYASQIATCMQLPEGQVKLLKHAALLHDIGKIGVPTSILTKPSKLTDEEYEILKKHPQVGEEMLKPVIRNKKILEIVRWHHERYDGKGYPDKVSGEETGLLVSIITVADTYDAMTSTRPYRNAMTKEVAIEELLKHKGTQFMPEVVDTFIKTL